jgi:crotonobetainyl-CoA:carnitine CoA-transferase CaiB-like acyl-CoA transferase
MGELKLNQQVNPNESGELSTKPLPLKSIRVIDFSRLLPGPWATQLLGELGADVIKVEQPGIGDPSRFNYPRYRKNSVYFNVVNGNKRSIAIDLTKPEGRSVAHRLLKTADIVFESYRPGVARKLKVDYDSARAINPRLIYCSISGFGNSGPLSKIAGHDLIIQALTGLMGRSLDMQNPPGVPGFQAGDFAGSLIGVIGTIAALLQRQMTGTGCYIDVSMFDALMYMCPVPLTSALARLAGHSGEPRQEVFGRNPRYTTYTSKDGKPVAIALLEAKAWQEFCESIGRPDLISKNESAADRLTTHADRRQLYYDVLTEYCATHTQQEIDKKLHETGIAISPVFTPDQALAADNVSAREIISAIEHPEEGRVPHLSNPLARAGLSVAKNGPAPGLGKDSESILASLEYSEAEIATLRKAQVI